MVNVKINGKAFSVKEGTILEACRSCGFDIPTLCYLKDINEIGACRVCLVEVVGNDRLVASCNNYVTEGMEILTNTPKVISARKVNVELILSQHEGNCLNCIRNGNCSLQRISETFGITEIAYEKKYPKTSWDNSFPLVRNESKCIKCMRCVQICEKVQTLGIWDVAKSGHRTTVGVKGGIGIGEADCALCGQCVTHCPVGALHERDDSSKVFAVNGFLGNKQDKIVVASVAPAVRAAWGEELGLSPEQATPGRLAAALKALGFDFVFDTNYGADLTIMEEGSEFLERLSHREDFKYPMFTSCCPGWVRFMKTQYPDMVENLSSAKSPQQMQGAMIKTYFAQKTGREASDIVNVSIMPCLAKKAECEIPTINASEKKDVDLVLTTRELVRQLKAARINVTMLEESSFDSPLTEGSGAAVIFGATGGVMEAALRSCYALVTGSNPPADAFKNIRGADGIREAEIEINGNKIRVAAASGLGNAARLLDSLKSGKTSYDFVEIMACPGGCAGGGGQPIHDGQELAEQRGHVLYRLDASSKLRFSHENKDVTETYNEFLGHPLSHKAHELLHTDHASWKVHE